MKQKPGHGIGVAGFRLPGQYGEDLLTVSGGREFCNLFLCKTNRLKADFDSTLQDSVLAL
jgi:hypothetical protein